MSRDSHRGKGWFTTYSTAETKRKAMMEKESRNEALVIQPLGVPSLKDFSSLSRPGRSLPFEALRSMAFHRDVGICQMCGFDTMALHAALAQIHIRCSEVRPAEHEAYQPFVEGSGTTWCPMSFAHVKMAVGRRAAKWPRSLWEADHVIPVSQGGRDELENLRTLCLECHWIETNRLIHGISPEKDSNV